MTVPFSGEVAQANGISFYVLPQDIDLNNIDLLMRPVVDRINSSGWVWTLECCQGHPDAVDEKDTNWDHNTNPYLRMIVKSEDLGGALSRLSRSMRLGGRTCVLRLTTAARGQYEEIILYVEAVNVIMRNQGIAALLIFADSLHTKEVTAVSKNNVKDIKPRLLVSRLNSLADKMGTDQRFSNIVGLRVGGQIRDLLKQAAFRLGEK